MSDKKDAASGGVGLSGLLAVLFIGLKLTGHIAWPWVWVLSPIWIPFALLIVLVALYVAVGLTWDWAKERKRAKSFKVRK